MSLSHSSIDARKEEILNVAVSTDTILYTPFFLAYHNSDFRDTPFQGLSVNIIGKKEDARFKDKKLKGDGFATFCLLFGLADAAICDPSYLVYLQTSANIEHEFSLFEELLDQSEKDSLSENSAYKDILNYNKATQKLEIENLNNFKRLFDDKKVIGGLVSKIAFSVVGSKNLADIAKSDAYSDESKERFGKIHYRSSNGKEFTRDNVNGDFIYYKSPSTGNCIGEIHAVIYNKKTQNKVRTVDFGSELTLLQENQHKNSVAITCDFVSLDFLNNSGERVFEIENLAADNKSYLFTGILGNCKINNLPKLQSLLYGIDKNLFFINKYIKDRDTTGLTKFLKNKFNYLENKEEELLELLVADKKCREEIIADIKDSSKGEFNFDTIILYYVKRLYAWKKFGDLYYDKTTPEFLHLKNIVELRNEAMQTGKEPDEHLINFLIQDDLLYVWREEEKKYFNYENNVNRLRLKEENTDFLTLLASPFMFKGHWKEILYTKLWFYISKPSYLYGIGSWFLILEVVSSLCHIFGFHLPFSWYTLHMPISSTHYIPFPLIVINIILFLYFNVTIVRLILIARKLMKLKENDKYVYRNE